MGRPRGRRSARYEEKRRALARKVFDCVHADGNASLHRIADAAGVSRPTLRHYFGDRAGAVHAALELAGELGRPHQESLLRLPTEDAGVCLTQALLRVSEGWRGVGVGHIHEVGLKAGLESEDTGQVYVSHVLEPFLQAFEALLVQLQEAGRLRTHSPRSGALMLVSPLVLALIHQDGLCGASVRPLDVDALVDDVVGAFVAAYGVPAAGSVATEGPPHSM